MLTSALETLNDTRLPWAVSRGDFDLTASAPGIGLPGRGSPTHGSHGFKRQSSFSSVTPPSAVTTTAGVPVSLPRLPGASGDLPPELANAGGKWFAKTVGEDALLVTFLPSIDVWREVTTERLSARRKAAAKRKGSSEVSAAVEAAHGRNRVDVADIDAPNPGGGNSIGRTTGSECRKEVEDPRIPSEKAAGKASECVVISGTHRDPGGDDVSSTTPPQQKMDTGVQEVATRTGRVQDLLNEEHSLGLFLFLVRSGDVGLPIELPCGMLQDVRKILLAHIPERPRGALAFKPRQR